MTATTRTCLLLALSVALPSLAHAQHAPLIEHMGGTPAPAPAPVTSAPTPTPAAPPAAPAPLEADPPLAFVDAAPPAPPAAPAPPPPPPPPPVAAAPAWVPPPPPPARTRHEGIGEATRALLELQASARSAGAALPMLGEAASRAYQRYLASFEHPIPEFFEATLPDAEQGGGR